MTSTLMLDVALSIFKTLIGKINSKKSQFILNLYALISNVLNISFRNCVIFIDETFY